MVAELSHGLLSFEQSGQCHFPTRLVAPRAEIAKRLPQTLRSKQEIAQIENCEGEPYVEPKAAVADISAVRLGLRDVDVR